MSGVPANVLYTSTLKDSAGNVIAGRTLTFGHRATGGTSFSVDGTGVTNTTGTASFQTTTSPVSQGVAYDFEVTFAGDTNYQASTFTLTNQITKAPTGLNLTVVVA